MITTEAQWYAVYTKPRFEKKVHSLLLLKGIESYCPLVKTKKKYTDRYKVVEEPLFKSYVFLKITEKQILDVKMTHGVINFVFWIQKLAIIKEEEIITIKKFLNEYKNVTVEKLDLVENQTVKITAGLLMDHEAIIKKVMKNKVIAELKTIGFQLVAEIEKKDLMIL